MNESVSMMSASVCRAPYTMAFVAAVLLCAVYYEAQDPPFRGYNVSSATPPKLLVGMAQHANRQQFDTSFYWRSAVFTAGATAGLFYTLKSSAWSGCKEWAFLLFVSFLCNYWGRAFLDFRHSALPAAHTHHYLKHLGEQV